MHPSAESPGPYDRQRSARREPAEIAAHAPYGDRILGWLGRVLRLGIAGEHKLRATGTGHPSRRDRMARDTPERAPTQPAAISFWGELNPTERAALLSVAYWMKFSIGDRLMREGEPADYVILIIEGQTRVCVDRNGLERVLAERGPGQLVGERGGLQVGVRSASVIAIEPVWGLMVLTADFLAFVEDHPRVLDIVESQLYDRLTEDRPLGAFSAASGARRPGTVWPALTAGQLPARPLYGHNCTILFTDVVAFGSPTRNDEDRRMIREALYGMTHTMLRGIGDARSEDRGDGLLTVVPPGIPTADIMERLVKELPPALARHNATFRDSARFQLRAAINVGPVTTDTMGVSGEAIIVAARLVEAPIFKEAIAKTHANVGIIASSFVYDAVIRHSPNPIDVAGYSLVQVSLKDFAAPAWIKLFTTPPSFPLAQSAAASHFDWRI